MSDYETCPKCNGAGKILSQTAIGRQLRHLRKQSGKSLRTVATMMGISAPFLSDCELGRRRLSAANRKLFDEVTK